MLRYFIRAAVCGAYFCCLALSQSEDQYNTNQRILKIRELGKRGASAIPALSQYLTDPNSDIRIEAVKAIVRIDTAGSIDPLVQATHDNDPEVQIRATDGLVNAYLPGYVVKSGLTSSLTRGVRQAKEYFSSRNDQVIDEDVTIRPDVAQALSDLVRGGASTDARANAARGAGILRDKAAVPSLLQGLHSRDNQTILECLIALQKIRDPSAGPGVSFLTHDLDDKVQATALETIGVLRSLPSAPDVRTVLQNPRNMRVRRAALQALAMLGIASERSTFQQYANDKVPELRSAALEGLGRIREPEDTPLIQQAYDQPGADWRIHLAAAFALVDEGKVDNVEFSPLAYLVETLDTRSRASVATAYLMELARRDDVRTALFKLVPEATKDQKVALCLIFGSTRNPDVTPVLTTLARDIDPDVAFAASKALKMVQARTIS